MIKIENLNVYGFEAAIRGMRNPMNSWEMGDSHSCCEAGSSRCGYMEKCDSNSCFDVGEKDLALMKKLIAAGSDHSKFMRMIVVTCDITAPLYWWKEFDTYKVGTVRNSCSTMHKIHSKPFTMEDFSVDDFVVDGDVTEIALSDMFINVIADCEELRQGYNETGEKKYWRGLIQLLPSSYNQRATVQLNYAVLRNMYRSRKDHKLNEWRLFCHWIEDVLPYSDLITGSEEVSS